MLAAEQGSLEIVQELVRRGANVNLDDVVSESNTQSVGLMRVSSSGCSASQLGNMLLLFECFY